MPVAIGPQCFGHLFTLTQMLGVIQNEALLHNNISKAGIMELTRSIMHLHDEGGCNITLLNACVDEAAACIDALDTAYGKEDLEDLDAMAGEIGNTLIDFLRCFTDSAAVAFEEGDDSPFVDWPEEGTGWVQWIRPLRQVVR